MPIDGLDLITHFLLPSQTDLRVDRVVADEQTHTLTVEVTSTQTAPTCPGCAAATTRVHSTYTRTLADLPWADVSVRVQLQVRKCKCPTATCSRQIFCERLPHVAHPWARRTARLAAHQQRIGVALGGAAGERLADELDQPASRDTLLRLVRALDLPAPPTPRILGVDDWARRKGHTYGTILIDIERGTIIDLLPDRSAESLAHWLKEHPGVEVISRDRGGAYADGARTGAPAAVQVAERWHLLKNVGEALVKLFDQQRAAIEATLGLPAAASPTAEAAPAAAVVIVPTATSSRTDAVETCPPEVRRARYDEVCSLYAQGWSLSAIADHVGLHRDTVRIYLQAPSFPQRQPRSLQASILDPFKPYILNDGMRAAIPER